MRRKELKRLQRSVRVYSSGKTQRPQKAYGDSHYSHMLLDDVTNGLVPYSIRKDADINAALEPASEDVARIIAEGIGRDQHWPDLRQSTFDFLREVAQTLLAFGKAQYEIVYLTEIDSEKIIGFDLSSIPSWTLTRRRDFWVQTISEEDAKRFQMPSEIELPASSVAELRLPPTISEYFARMMADLELLGRTLYPEFGIPISGSSAQDVGFEFSEWHRCHEIAVAEATKHCGWNARNSFSEKTTEFYFLHRFLKFERFKLELRTSILSQLNAVLRIVGDRIGFSGQIVLHGLPDTEQIQNSMRELESDKTSFADVMKPYMQY